jgi:hypothetical protein
VVREARNEREDYIIKYRVFQKEFYNIIPNASVWRVLQVLHFKPWIVCIPSSVNVFVTLTTQLHLEYNYKAFLKHPALPVKVTLIRNYPR